MSRQMKNPAKRCNADGAVNAESLQGNHPMSLPSTASFGQIPVILLPMETYDNATAKLAQLRALLHSITAESGASFNCLSQALQADVLWLASDLADTAHDSLIEGVNHG